MGGSERVSERGESVCVCVNMCFGFTVSAHQVTLHAAVPRVDLQEVSHQQKPQRHFSIASASLSRFPCVYRKTGEERMDQARSCDWKWDEIPTCEEITRPHHHFPSSLAFTGERKGVKRRTRQALVIERGIK